MKPTNHSTHRLALVLALAAVPLLFASCATGPTTLGAVGPRPTLYRASLSEGTGHLIVYTATEVKNIGKEARYYMHTDYTIRTPDQKFFKRVPNHFGDMDQSAQLVTLPAGIYQIMAQSETYGMVTMPVVIGAGNTTEIHLEGRWNPKHKPENDQDIVRLPNGQNVGWRANIAANETK